MGILYVATTTSEICHRAKAAFQEFLMVNFGEFLCCLKDKAIYIYDNQFWHEQNQPVVGVGGVGGVGGLRWGFLQLGDPQNQDFQY